MKKQLIIVAISLLTAGAVHAQDKLQGMAEPGWQFAPVKIKRTATVTTIAEKHDESISAQLKKGTMPGMRFQPGGSSTTAGAAKATPATAKTGTLASEATQTIVKPITSVQPELPTQEAAPVKQ